MRDLHKRIAGNRLTRPAIRRSTGAWLLLILVATASAIYEGLAQATAKWLWGSIWRLQALPGWWPGFLVGAFVAALLVGVLSGRQLSRVRTSRGVVVKLTQLDDTLVRSLPYLVHAKDRERRMRRLLEETLSDCASIFGDQVLRAAVYRVDGEYLQRRS